jgi:hypothetical protein
MNFRKSLKNIDLDKPIKISNLIELIVNWLFWRKAKKRHKKHAANWAIFKEGKSFYPAKYHHIYGWEYIGKPGPPNDLYLWITDYRTHAICKTRYEALRRIALARRKYCFTEFTRT